MAAVRPLTADGMSGGGYRAPYGKRGAPLADRLLPRIEYELNTGCWLWNASGRGGYGMIRVNNRSVPSHRASWHAHVGPIPTGLCVLHKCDTPACINPHHLFLGTKAVNAADRHAKGRDGDHKGTAHGNSKLNDEAVRAIRAAPNRRGVTIDLATRFGVQTACISKVRRGQTWTHVQ